MELGQPEARIIKVVDQRTRKREARVREHEITKEKKIIVLHFIFVFFNLGDTLVVCFRLVLELYTIDFVLCNHIIHHVFTWTHGDN